MDILRQIPNELTEQAALKNLFDKTKIDSRLRNNIERRAIELVKTIRNDSSPSMMELFLGEYGLSSEEGVALMCLAEALLRVPDGPTIDELIEDKIAPSAWGQHLGQSHSSLVNASTWALFVTGKVLNDKDTGSITGILHGAIKRLGEPVIRQAVTQVMKEMGRQFVLGETIETAMDRARHKQEEGFTYSYDMLGEAAKTEADAKRYHLAYSQAISALAKHSHSLDIRNNPGISIKLSALHPRYELLQKKRVMETLLPRARSLAILAKSADIGLNIDAEEAGRLCLSLELIEAMFTDPIFDGWDGFGVVVQAYSLRAPYVIDALYELAKKHNRKIMIRLVKGAYWDTEIKLSQMEGHPTFPVFTQKPSTDVSYLCCAEKLLGMTTHIYPQFATHNAHTVAAILEMSNDKTNFEFQRLHGMGEALHDTVQKRHQTKCRIYAPVGAHKDLLAYLVRRLLENGANSSFVNQIVDENVAPEIVAADPFNTVAKYLKNPKNPAILQPDELFQPARRNSKGYDLSNNIILSQIETGIAKFDQSLTHISAGDGELIEVHNPATLKKIGSIKTHSLNDIKTICENIENWSNCPSTKRAKILNRVADLYEANTHQIFSLLVKEAGKTLIDSIGEIREAVDFLRYYASQIEHEKPDPEGIFVCISPWNFPLAIFTGQISAALACGNGVLAKPAETTNLIASFAISLFYQAGVPETVLQLVFGQGAIVGDALTKYQNVNGVCFTGSTKTAQIINKNMAQHLPPRAPLIAETGGLNAMIIDSTALPEQAVSDVIASAFQSAGQRCSALRILYLQSEIADNILDMLYGAMAELKVGNPRQFDTDVGPIIDRKSADKISNYIDNARKQGRLLKQSTSSLPQGHFVNPAIIKISGIQAMGEEIFGPVLHVAIFEHNELDTIISDINAKGYGLTFGLHSRIDDRVQKITEQVQAGNIYINRNQIGAVVGSQPFGGEGLSGTGPKAGGPLYLNRFSKAEHQWSEPVQGNSVDCLKVEDAFKSLELKSKPRKVSNLIELPGPTGESNQYGTIARKRVLCLGPTADLVGQQVATAEQLGCIALGVAPNFKNGINGIISPDCLEKISNLNAVIYEAEDARAYRQSLAQRNGPIVPLLQDKDYADWLVIERHVCIDTTAAGGNAALLGG